MIFELLFLHYQQVLTYILYSWIALALIGIPVLYVGYGFVMSAQMASKKPEGEGRTQRKVLFVDGFIALLFLLLDVILNVLVLSVLTLDFRWSKTFTMITSRLSQYNTNPDELPYRQWYATFFAAFLDGKDYAGKHIKGAKFTFKWLD